MFLAACLFASTAATAENWHFTPSAGITETFTDNVNYAPRDGAKNDFVTSVSAALGISGEGKRVKLSGNIGAAAELYARESQNNAITPNVSLVGSVEAIEQLLFVDANANVSTQFLSPFGPQPGSTVNATNNRYTSQTYAVNPYVRGEFRGSGIAYQLRDENIWTIGGTYGDSSVKPPSTYLNRLTGSLESAARPFGWRFEYERNDYDNGLNSQQFAGAGKFLTQVARAIVARQFDGQWTLSARGGYDMADFPLSSSEGAVYGLGFEWTPGERTRASGYWEHRFFGSSYDWRISHRLPNSAISASFTRNLGTYPQSALTIPAGAAVSQFVDAAFTSRIPDPVARQQAVEKFLAQSGLPAVLAAPVNVYTAQVQLQTSQNASYVVIGQRNSVAFTVFNNKTEAIAGTGDVLPPELQFGTNDTQTGAGVAFSHQLTGFTNFNAFASYSRTKSNDSNAKNLKANNGDVGINLSTRFGAKTTGSMGVSYSLYKVRSGSNEPDTDALSIFAGVNHTF